MGERPFLYEAKRGSIRVYTCDVCRLPFEWSEGAEWYGSEKACDNAEWDKITFVCSAACKENFASRQRRKQAAESGGE